MEECIVVIPAYKRYLNDFERTSIQRTVSVLKDWPMAYVIPDSLRLSADYPEGPATVRMPDSCFESRDSYSRMCESPDFYGIFTGFSAYEYMLICQTDAWIFADHFRDFTKMSYDYIGGPHLYRGRLETGNGGLSLRRIEAFIRVCTVENMDRFAGMPEDVVFSHHLKDRLNIAPLEVAARFSYQNRPSYCYSLTGHLPFGCHQPYRNQWKSFYLNNTDMKKEINARSGQKKTEAKKSGPYLVVIPWIASQANGRELEMAVAGWRKHFKEDYRIVIVGDRNGIAGDDVTFIEMPRIEHPDAIGMCIKHLEFVRCFKAVHEMFPESEGMIFAADDNYAVNDFDIHDIRFLKANSPEIGGDPASSNSWQRDKFRTKTVLKEIGKPTINFTTHIPCFFEWSKLLPLYERFSMDRESYVIEDLYFNIYFPDRRPLFLNIDTDNQRCGVWRANPRMNYIEKAFASQIWITNSPEGYIPALEDMLLKHYGLK